MMNSRIYGETERRKKKERAEQGKKEDVAGKK
jgi:hypothetical protein